MISISQGELLKMVRHAEREAPNECCGVLVGTGTEVNRTVPMVNAEASPVSFRMDPLSLVRVLDSLDDSGEQLAGFYHSHPRTEAYPSPTDRQYAPGYPDVAHIIISLRNSARPSVRAFRIDGEHVEEEEVVIC